MDIRLIVPGRPAFPRSQKLRQYFPGSFNHLRPRGSGEGNRAEEDKKDDAHSTKNH
jgi:hypothetical protein